FEIDIEGCVPALPSSRRVLEFAPAGERARWRCDLLLDLTGGTPLFPGFARRDGYLRPDPGDPVAVQRALFDMAGLVGDFEKPRYVAYDAAVFAPFRSRKTGCTRRLESCPAGARWSHGDAGAIDPLICPGCANC